MKTLAILTRENPSEQWIEWIHSLVYTDLIVEEINPNPINYEALMDLHSDVVLLDGMLPQLSQIITFLRSRNMDIQIIVATAFTSFTIQYELWKLGENDYLAGPMDADEFATRLCDRIPGASIRSNKSSVNPPHCVRVVHAAHA